VRTYYTIALLFRGSACPPAVGAAMLLGVGGRSLMHSTPISLLDRIRQSTDAGAWVSFVRLYAPLLSRWARSTGPDDTGAADLVQDVFTVLVQKLPTFQYDSRRSFRGWLRVILVNRWRELKRKHLPIPVDRLDHIADDAEPLFPDEADECDQLLRRALNALATS
jgi:RNA polymerase sigma-70 factor, ECF subfamily